MAETLESKVERIKADRRAFLTRMGVGEEILAEIER